MGERDPGLGPPPPRPPWAQRGALAVALVALLVVALALGPVEAPAGGGAPSLVAALLEAPLTAAVGDRGPAILGWLALALAALLACRALEPRVGPSAALLVALLIFGSCGWGLLWSDGGALVPLALAIAALALAYAGGDRSERPAEIYRPQESRWRGVGRWLLVGLLLAELLPSSPLLAALLLPAAAAVPRERRGALLSLLLAGFAAGLGAELVTRGAAPITDFAAAVAASVSLDPLLAGRGLLSLVAGRNVGLLAGFAPALLLLLLGRGSATRPALAATVLTVPAIGALLLPFDFAAGWLNLTFLPLYGALWLLPCRPPRRWEWTAVVLLGALAGWPLLVAPRAALADGGVGLTAGWPRRHLPYEAALRSLPNRGQGEVPGEGVRLRAVSGCRLRGGSGRVELIGAGPAELWLAAPAELGMVGLEFGPGAPSSFQVAGATAGRTVFRPDGRVGFEVLLDRPLARHPLWFGDAMQAAHLVRLRLPGAEGDRPLRFRLLARPQPQPVERTKEQAR